MPGSAPDAEIPSGEPDVQPSTGFDPAYSGETGIGQSISQIAHLAFRQERYADQSAVIDANNRFADEATNALEDPKSGLLNQSAGKDAPKLADQTMSDLQNKRLEIMNGLGNDRQKVLFDRYSDEHRRMAQRRAFAWEKQQTDAYEQDNLEAAIANHQRNAVALADPSVPVDPVTGQDHVAQMEHQVDWQKEQIADFGNTKAWPQSKIEMKQNEAASQSYIGVIDSLVTGGHTDLAQQIYDRHGDEIDATKRAHVLDAIRSTRNDQAAEKQFATLMQRDKDNQFPDQATFQDRLDNANLDPLLYDKVRKLGNDHFTLQEEANKATQAQTVNTALKVLADGGDINQAKAAIGAVGWQSLDGQVRLNIENEAEHRAKKNGPEPLSQTYIDLYRMMDTPAAQHIDLAKEALGKVTTEEFKELMSHQREYAQRAIKGSTDPDSVTTDKEVIGNALDNLAIKDRNSNDALAFTRAYLREAKIKAADKKAPLDDDDKAAIANKLQGGYTTTVARSAWSPLRWFGSQTTEQDQGALYKQPKDIIDRNALLPPAAKALPTTYEKAGLTPDMTADVLHRLEAGGASTRMMLKELDYWRTGFDLNANPVPKDRYNLLIDSIRQDPGLRARFQEAIRANIDLTHNASVKSVYNDLLTRLGGP